MKTLLLVYLSLVVLAMAACQKSNTDANVPAITTDCLNNPNLCNSGVYQQTPGFTPYNYGSSPYGGGYTNGYNPFLASSSGALCNCPVGSIPTYNNYSGLGCVQSSLIYGYGYGYGYASFTYASDNNQWTNRPQISNTVGYGSAASAGCYSGVVQSCLVGDTSTCSAGYTCRPAGASARLGVCVIRNY